MLRSGDRPGVEQELWALLALYQLLRMAMVTAVETRPGTDPDRVGLDKALILRSGAAVCRPVGPALACSPSRRVRLSMRRPASARPAHVISRGIRSR